MPVSKRTASMQPYWKSECGRAVVYVGDCRKVTPHMEPEQFYAVVTDPPYNLTSDNAAYKFKYTGSGNYSQGRENRRKGFMGQDWDGTGVAFDPKTWEAVLRVAKPGAHLLSFGGTRTWHRMACAIEDGGFDIRDTLMWVYGSGFPKSHNVSKAIDKALGAERTEVIGKGQAALAQGQFNSRDIGSGGYGYKEDYDVTAPATEEAKQWQGWGTCLKPAFEPVVLARKPLGGTVAQCVMENGTGGLNIDECRIGDSGGCKHIDGTGGFDAGTVSALGGHLNSTRSPSAVGLGRWPANLIHDGSEEVVDLLDKQAGVRKGGEKPAPSNSVPGANGTMGKGWSGSNLTGKRTVLDSGSAARFFYTAKADESDRPHGKGATAHPTVKPLDLMSYLVRLVCVQGGTVLDPFMGSGSTGCAAIVEGMRFVGIEQSQEYADLAVGKLRLALQGKGEQETPPPPKRLRG